MATFGESTSAGIPESFIHETLVLALNDLKAFEETLEQHAHEIAAVIIEPVPANNGLLLQDQNYLVWLRTLCDKYDVLLIFDEVISGFRVGFEGASGYYTIEPDIITFGKIIGGGMPVGAYGARKEIMSHVAPDGPVYQAGTLSANPVAMSAGIATMKKLLRDGFYEEMNHKTQTFTHSIQEHIDSKGYEMHMVQIGSIFWFAFSNSRIISADQIDAKKMEIFKKMHHELLQQNVYLGPSGYEVGFVSAAHTSSDLDEASSKICNTLDKVMS